MKYLIKQEERWLVLLEEILVSLPLAWEKCGWTPPREIYHNDLLKVCGGSHINLKQLILFTVVTRSIFAIKIIEEHIFGNLPFLLESTLVYS